MGLAYLMNFWPVLAVFAAVLAGYGILVFFTGKRRPFEIGVYFAASALLSYLAYNVLEQSGMAGLLTDDYTEDSVAALGELCLHACKGGHNTHLCPAYCECFITRSRRLLTYRETLETITGRADQRATRLFNQISRTCAYRVVDG